MKCPTCGGETYSLNKNSSYCRKCGCLPAYLPTPEDIQRETAKIKARNMVLKQQQKG